MDHNRWNLQFSGVERQFLRDLGQSFAGAVDDGAFAGALRRARRIVLARTDFQEIPFHVTFYNIRNKKIQVERSCILEGIPGGCPEDPIDGAASAPWLFHRQ